LITHRSIEASLQLSKRGSLCFPARSQLLSSHRKRHQCFVVQAGGALSVVVLCYQITISVIFEVTPPYPRV
jgi:hypothetical protein